MDISFAYKTQTLRKAKADCVLIFLPEATDFNPAIEVSKHLEALPKTVHGYINETLKLKVFSGKSSDLQVIFPPDSPLPQVMLSGLGKPEKITSESLRRAAGKAGKRLTEMKIDKLAVLIPDFLSEDLGNTIGPAVVEGLTLGSYQFNTYKTKKSNNTPNPIDALIYDPQKQSSAKAVKASKIKADATNFARNLGNAPANDMTPCVLAEQAQAIAKTHGLDYQVLEEAEMKELGMDMLLGVSQGAEEPAKLVILQYTHPKAKETIAFVGKGVTFDSGGISLKPGKDMDEMKFDMCGAAAVLGAMQAIGALKPKVNVIGVTPATENMPSGTAQRPGDIVKSYAGKTVEILNTDAEGRLILGDALTYTAQKFQPSAIVDLATLTGACIIALGHHASGAITNNEALMSKVQAAGASSGDRVWALPSYEEYDEQLKGKYGDLQNIGGRAAGTITAGLFLKNFVEETPWVHLDIAGTAWNVKGVDHIPNQGATGVGVRLLVDLAQGWNGL